jgi:hypothetical protein
MDDLTALTEGTIGAIFAHVRYLIEVDAAAESRGSTSLGEDWVERGDPAGPRTRRDRGGPGTPAA